VQGVGFRPALHRLAARQGLAGTITNSDRGVVAHLEGDRSALEGLLEQLDDGLPPHAEVQEREEAWSEAQGAQGLRVVASQDGGARGARIPSDLASCADCLAELFDPGDRRHGYPFTNCTNCGPRFTIAREVPYDRVRTSMAPFALCPDCAAEYEDLADRRYHAEPTACPVCGPALTYSDTQAQGEQGAAALAAARDLLDAGEVLALKGLGGFHLSADATRDDAVDRLRRRKRRPHRPLAVMARDLPQARALALVDAESEALLTSAAAPIVLLPARPGGGGLSALVAPGTDRVGLMLPYTPLHHLLLRGSAPLVMTSGNLSEEPIAVNGAEARRRLAGIAAGYLDHDREILVACEDSVVTPARTGSLFIRRSRGYVPEPLPLPRDAGCALAVGGQLKNTVCLTHGRQAFPGPHTGDLDSAAGQAAFVRAVDHLCRLLRLEPEAVVHDAHPDYFTTRHAQGLGLPSLAVQHHHAHAAAVAGEHGCDGPLLALCLDGTGYGDDGVIWGAELLELPDPGRYRRLGGLRRFPLPGGERAVREPWRAALGLCSELLGDEGLTRAGRLLALDDERTEAARGMIRAGVALARTSSCGRLFDAVAALCGLGRAPTYEAQPAVELEAAARRAGAPAAPYPMALDGLTLDPALALEQILADLERGAEPAQVAARFHLGLAAGLSALAARAAARTGTSQVALAGGCLVNQVLRDALVRGLSRQGLQPLLPRLLPPNDGAISYGQAVVWAWQR